MRTPVGKPEIVPRENREEYFCGIHKAMHLVMLEGGEHACLFCARDALLESIDALRCECETEILHPAEVVERFLPLGEKDHILAWGWRFLPNMQYAPEESEVVPSCERSQMACGYKYWAGIPESLHLLYVISVLYILIDSRSKLQFEPFSVSFKRELLRIIETKTFLNRRLSISHLLGVTKHRRPDWG